MPAIAEKTAKKLEEALNSCNERLAFLLRDGRLEDIKERGDEEAELLVLDMMEIMVGVISGQGCRW